MSTNKTCTNCPGATDHDTAHCPLRPVIHLGDLNPEQRLALARGHHPEPVEGAQGEREAFDACCARMIDCTDEVNRDWLWRFVQRWGEARAALAQPSPAPELELERPEVVAFLMKPDTYEPYVGLSRDSSCSHSEQLMTVAQHARIVGALRAERDRLKAGVESDWAEVERLQVYADEQFRKRHEMRKERDAAQAKVMILHMPAAAPAQGDE